jgi:DNA-binding transcriptional MerR regulator
MAAAENVRYLATGKLYNIGQVLARLQGDFADLSESKLRYLEEQGIVTPQRTPAGYRKFAETDVQRLQLALSLQRDQYLPLKVIRTYLDDLEDGKSPQLPSAAPSSGAIRIPKKKVSAIDLIAETGITDSLLAQAQEVLLIGAEPFDQSEVEIARSIMQLQRFGIAPRHLKGAKAAAIREIGIIEGVVAPVVAKKDTASRAKAAQFAFEMEALFAVIRSNLIRAAISKIDD